MHKTLRFSCVYTSIYFVNFCSLLIIIHILLPISSVFAVLRKSRNASVKQGKIPNTLFVVSACQVEARRAWRLVKQRVEMTCTMKVWRGGSKREGKQLRCIHKAVYRLYGVSRVQKEPHAGIINIQETLDQILFTPAVIKQRIDVSTRADITWQWMSNLKRRLRSDASYLEFVIEPLTILASHPSGPCKNSRWIFIFV